MVSEIIDSVHMKDLLIEFEPTNIYLICTQFKGVGKLWLLISSQMYNIIDLSIISKYAIYLISCYLIHSICICPVANISNNTQPMIFQLKKTCLIVCLKKCM